MRHKYILWLIALCLSVSNLFAQNTAQVTAIQYYFNTDPGVGIAGNGAIVPVSPIGSINQTFTIPLPVLSNGLQNLYVRAKDEFDRWGMAERRLFYVNTFEANNIISYQYYFDTDPGVGIAGNGAVITVSSTINYNQTVSLVVPNSLSAGLHNLYIRTQNDLGRWSIAERRIFFITTYEANNIVNYQYYFDTDPGVGIIGNGAITAVTSTTNLTQTFAPTIPNSLAQGIHNFYVRVQNDLGRWSIIERRLFFVSLYEANNIIAYQYYFDTDPGVGIAGNGAIVPVSSTTNLTQNAVIALPNTLSSGIHDLYVRTRNDLGRWSITERRLFYIENNVTENISGLEYFYDTDPGVGNGTQIPIPTTASINQAYAIYLQCTTPGAHKLFVRAKDSFGRWSIFERGTFTALSGIAASVITADGPVTFCQGGSVVLSTSPAVTGITYQWMQNGLPVSGQNSISTTVTTTGSYTLQASCNGNTIQSTPIVVTINTPAVINACPLPITQCDNHVVTWSVPTATGLPAPAVTCTPASGSTFATGTTNVTCTATNNCGNSSCSFNVTVNESPVIGTCPITITQCDNPIVTFSTPSSTGTAPVSVSCSPASGSTFASGITSVTCSATNSCGNSTCSFNVIINETPVIGLCPSTITQCDNHVATWLTPSATGLPAPAVTCTPSSGSTFATGTTNVTCTATNNCGNSSCSFNVTVNESPVIGTCPSAIIECDNHVATWLTPSATGSPNAVVSCLPSSGSTFATGITSVNCTATNSCGNSGCSFNVTINETPVISCPADINGGTNNINGMVQTYTAPTGGSPAAMANCIPASGSMFPLGTTVVNCSAANSCGTGTCSFNVIITLLCTPPVISACPSNIAQCTNVASWADPTATGTLPFVNCVPASGSTFSAGITQVTCTASNACGTDQCSFNVTINQSPVIGACPAAVTTCNAVVTYSSPSATGYPAPTVTCTPASGSTFGAGTTLTTCSAVNICGTSSCTFNITVQSASTVATSASANATTICFGNQVTLSASGGALGLGASWKWYDGGCGFSASIGSGLSITITPSTSGIHNYFVRAEGLCDTTLCKSVSVNVNTSGPTNTVHVTASPGIGCLGNPPNILSVNTANGATFYNFSCSQGGVLFNGFPSPYQSLSPSVNVTFNALPPNGTSGWSICIFAGNPCGNSNTICKWVRATLSKPDSIAGSVVGCPGATGISYNAAIVSGAASYQWSSTGGIVINNNGAQAITVDFPVGFVSGILSVHGQTSCGYNGPNANMTISHIPAIPSTITGTSFPCPNASTVYSITPVSGAASYTWNTSVPGAVVAGTSTTCSIAFPAFIPGGSSVSVFANSICPSAGSVRAKGIASGLPNTPSAISGPASGQCAQTGVSYSINPVALATGYNWNTACGSIIGPVNLSGITVDWPASFNTCNITVSVTNNCGTGGTRTLPVIAAPSTPAAILGNAAPCANAVEIYTVSGSSGATAFIWTVPAGVSILGPVNGSSILLQWGTSSGSITVKASNACGLSLIRTLPCVISCRMNQSNISAGIFNAEVFPNPSQGKATLKINASSGSAFNLYLSDGLGRNVMSSQIMVNSGLNLIELDLGTIAKGVYLLRIIGNEQSIQIKLIVE